MIKGLWIPSLIAAASLSLSACSMQPRHIVEDPTDLLLDDVFVNAFGILPAIEPPNLFDLPANYQQDLDRIVASTDSEYERYKKMRAWIYRRFQDYDFDVTETYSLGQLNTNRKINCLSFSAMFVAAARYIDVPAEFQLVLAPPYWDRDGDNWINNQHINVTGEVDVGDVAGMRGYNDSLVHLSSSPAFSWRWGATTAAEVLPNYRYTADINPAVLSINSGRRKITEQQVISLFYSNKSVEALLDHDLLLAYAYTKLALQSDPDSSIAWNNLGVLYARVDRQDFSVAAYERAVALDEKMYSAKSNLANSYRASGSRVKAEAIEAEIESFRNQNPYYHSALADQSIAAGDLQQALDQLQEAVAQKRNEHFFYHQLAIVSQQLGDREAVVEHLNSARRYARGTEKLRFAGKLKALEEIANLATSP